MPRRLWASRNDGGLETRCQYGGYAFDFYDRYTRAMTECHTRFDEVLAAILDFGANIVSFVISIELAVSIDPVLLIVLILPLVSAVFTNKQNKNEYDKDMKLTQSERQTARIQHQSVILKTKLFFVWHDRL